MPGIMCLTETISRNEFRCNYLKYKKLFLNFFFAFLKSKLKFNINQKRITLRADVFPEVSSPKNVVR